MCAISSTYLRFERLMDREKVYRNPNVTFRSLCRMLSVSPASLNEIILRELGIGGEELIDYYRDKDNICIALNF